jgi:hypothetical protein
LPIQRFCPLSTHRSPSRRAVVRSPAATSEPPVGSVSANAPIFAKVLIGGSQRSCCSHLRGEEGPDLLDDRGLLVAEQVLEPVQITHEQLRHARPIPAHRRGHAH